MTKKLLFSVLLHSLLCTAVWAQDKQLNGKVTAADDGSALPGVNVVVQGTSKGTTTDIDGNYSITLSPQENTIVFTFVGYTSQTVTVGDRTTIDVVLDPDITALGEVVVVGYGTQRKLDVTGAVVQLAGKEISKQPNINPISALQGKVAGVQITNLGAPGSSPEVRIRGLGSVYGKASPLFVVDGVWYEDISFLNPADIENISVLKDASSEAIYGIRAANGVVLITTKKGATDGNVVVSYDGYVGSQVPTNMIEMASGPEFATIINELDVANGDPGRYDDPSSYGTTDWYHQMLRAAVITNHQISLTGGTEKSNYAFSLGYLKQDGTVESNTFNRYTARFQNDLHPFKFLRIGYTVMGALNKAEEIDGNIFHQIYAAAPNVPVYYADGTYGDPYDFGVGNSNLFNPQVTNDYFNQNYKHYRMTGSIYAEAKFAKNFTFKTSLGGDYGEKEVRNYVPLYKATLSQRTDVSKLTVTDESTRSWIVENTLSYDKAFGDHAIKVLVGQGAQSNRFGKVILTGENVPADAEDQYLTIGNNFNIVDVDQVNVPKEYPLYSTILSYFGRVNYSFKEKYMLTVSLRADGSSKFEGDNRWGNFPSIGAGWVISEEDFMRNQNIFQTLKLRGSWGKVGNVSVPANVSVVQVTQAPPFIYVGGDGSVFQGANVNRVAPPTTFWEMGVGTDIGIEANLLSNKLFVELDYYNRKTEDAIFDVPILGSLGTTGSKLLGNQATFQNSGFEILARWNDNINQRLSYTISANMGINNNEVLEVSSGKTPIYQAVGTTGSNNWNTRTIVGEPIGQFYGLQVVGVFQNQEEIDNYQSSGGDVIQSTAAPGDFRYRDVNDDGSIDDKDQVVLGNPNPKFSYGINTTWTYDAFDLTLDFQGLAGVDIYNAELGLRYGTENFSKEFYDNRWHGEGTSNSYPSANIGGGQNYRANSFYVENGSYFRVRNIQIGYTLPSAVTDKWKITRFRVYANAQNALNFFKYRGFNPEVGGGATRAGVDLNVYPLFATYNAGVNVTF